jgi:hypothetical protein
MQSKKHGMREIVVSALRGQPGNIDFQAMTTKKVFIKKKNHSSLELLFIFL